MDRHPQGRSRLHAPGPVVAAVLGAVVACLCSAALLAFALSSERLVVHFVDSDKLLAADFTYRVFILGRPLMDFQLPRTPSIVPDLAVYAPVQLLFSWQAATFALAWLILSLLVTVGAFIAHRASRAPYWLCVAAMLMATLPLLLLEPWLSAKGEGRHFFVLSPVSHGGAFALSVCVLAICEASDRFRKAANVAIALLTGLVVLSDKLAVFELSIPGIVATWAFAASPGRARGIIVALAIGTLAGLGADHFLVHEPDIPVDFAAIEGRLAAALHDTVRSIIVGTWLPALAFVLPGLLALRRLRPTASAYWYWLAGSLAIVLTWVLTYAFLYRDAAYIRYLQAAMWWPVIGVAAALSWALNRLRRGRGLATAALAVLAAGSVATLGVWHARALFEWRHPLTECMRRLRTDLQLADGLARYDVARPLSISFDWDLQIDPITPGGDPFFWGNDLRSFEYRLRDPNHPPQYNFILVDWPDKDQTIRRFGRPTTVADCNGAEVWRYPESLLTPGRSR